MTSQYIKEFQGSILRNKRKQYGFKLREFAQYLAITHTTVKAWELGNNGIPMELIPFFSALFNMQISDWFPKNSSLGYLSQKRITSSTYSHTQV